ncbi:MAG: LytTR family DNA-binding domain-containing protein [Ferruginibacter sp.]
MLSAIIIDDELKGRAVLNQKLKEYCPLVTVTGEAAHGEEGLKIIETLKPDIIFLDIEMPRMNGFEMLSTIREKNFHVIFTTAYDQYAIKAIKYAAFDYLLKPIDIDELRSAVERIASNENINTRKQIELLQQNMQHPRKQLNKLAIPTLEGLFFYDINDIVQLEANRNYTYIFLINNAKILASKTLKDFEDLLPTDIFFRTHHSHLINLNYIKRYIKGDGGQIELQNGNFVDVARRKKEEFMKMIGY